MAARGPLLQLWAASRPGSSVSLRRSPRRFFAEEALPTLQNTGGGRRSISGRAVSWQNQRTFLSLLAWIPDTLHPVRRADIHEGSLSSAIVHPRKIVAPASANAAHILIAHNHPGGDHPQQIGYRNHLAIVQAPQSHRRRSYGSSLPWASAYYLCQPDAAGELPAGFPGLRRPAWVPLLGSFPPKESAGRKRIDKPVYNPYNSCIIIV